MSLDYLFTYGREDIDEPLLNRMSFSVTTTPIPVTRVPKNVFHIVAGARYQLINGNVVCVTSITHDMFAVGTAREEHSGVIEYYDEHTGYHMRESLHSFVFANAYD
jgi:hypothetical protein